jgi:4-amino-4-deoxy-L-arabinose transferase-like glycosyltransferase
MIVGAGLSALGYDLFSRDDALTQAWWLYLGSIGLFIAGGLLLTPDRSLPADLRHLLPSRGIAYGLAGVLLLALFLRLFNFTDQPFGIWFDEAEAGLQARQMLQNSSYRPVFYPAINVTGHLLALYALALHWLGDSISSMRVVSVLFGLGSVLAAYLFGRELRGPRFGLALAFFVAVARWPLNFSRIAMTGIDTLFFEFLALFFLARLLKRGQLRDALWAGLTLGAGIMFYTAFRLFLLALLIFAVVAALRWWKPLWATLRGGGWRRWSAVAVVLLVSGWLVVMPLAQYALDDPEGFWYRTRQISILTKRDQPDLGLALWESSRKHLLMFNVAGDKNGRHNLPGEPMLDPLMGMLMLLGLALAAARTRHPANLFFIILFPVALLGGIFSVDFEAPQSLRSIAVLPAALYFCALATAALGREAEQSLRPLPRGWIYGPAAVAALYILALNANTYFNRQANDFSSWNAFSAPETITGRKMAELGPDYAYYLSPFLTNHPSTRFLAPQIVNQNWLPLPDALPVRDPSGRPVALFIHPDDGWVYEQARRLYPNAEFEVLTGPSDPEGGNASPSVLFVGLQPADLAAVRGLDLRTLPVVGSDESTTLLAPLSSSRVYGIQATWPADSPTSDPFVAEWRGILYIPEFGPYTFRLQTPANGVLEIDGNVILEGTGEQQAVLTLAEGNHSLRLQADGAPGQVSLTWQPPGHAEEPIPAWALYALPVTNHGLLGSYYPNANWEGEPAFQRIDPFLNTYFHLIPLQRPYSVEWAGALVAPQSGVYRLGLRAVQDAELWLDDALLFKTLAPNQLTETSVTLEAGTHNLRIRYRDTVDRSRIHLTWTPPSGRFEPIPTEFLWPPLGSYPTPQAPATAAQESQSYRLQHLITLGFPGDGPGQFLEPRDVAVLSNGAIAVADTNNRRVQLFDSQYTFLTELRGDDLPFEEPLAVDVLRRETGDELLVLDSALQWIYRYDAAGNFIDRFGGPEARLFHPRGLLDNVGGLNLTGDWP